MESKVLLGAPWLSHTEKEHGRRDPLLALH
jgi:hypothetical protein